MSKVTGYLQKFLFIVLTAYYVDEWRDFFYIRF